MERKWEDEHRNTRKNSQIKGLGEWCVLTAPGLAQLKYLCAAPQETQTGKQEQGVCSERFTEVGLDGATNC